LGGSHGGGARLTPFGEALLGRYRALVATIEAAAATSAAALVADVLLQPRPAQRP